MRIEVIGRHFEVTDPIREYAEKKCDRLTRYLDMVQQIVWTIDKQSSTRNDYLIECVITVEKHADFVSKADHSDVYAAIDAATDKASRQLAEFKDRLKVNHH